MKVSLEKTLRRSLAILVGLLLLCGGIVWLARESGPASASQVVASSTGASVIVGPAPLAGRDWGSRTEELCPLFCPPFCRVAGCSISAGDRDSQSQASLPLEPLEIRLPSLMIGLPPRFLSEGRELSEAEFRSLGHRRINRTADGSGVGLSLIDTRYEPPALDLK